MRLSRAKSHKRLEINMTPMIDVVFQLLIFFMTCTQVSEANHEQLELPKLPGSSDQARGEVTVNITAGGEYRIMGEAITLPAIVSRCLAEMERLGSDPSKLTVVVRADRRVPSRAVNELINALTKLEITRVRLAVEVAQ